MAALIGTPVIAFGADRGDTECDGGLRGPLSQRNDPFGRAGDLGLAECVADGDGAAAVTATIGTVVGGVGGVAAGGDTEQDQAGRCEQGQQGEDAVGEGPDRRMGSHVVSLTAVGTSEN